MFKLGKESAAPEQKGADRDNSGKGWLRSHWCALALFAIIVVAFALRTVFAYGISADGDFALSGGSSAQYHLHVVESILNGSYSLTDSSVNYPIGGLAVYPPLNDFLAAGVASLLGAFGMGTTEAASAALAVISPVFGALACIPVYLIGREMFDRRVGVVAALVFAFLALPISSTVFSNGNPYALAAFLIAFMSYFLVKMVKAADAEDGSKKAVLLNGALAGVFLLLAALAWNGFRFAVVLLALAMVLQIVADRLRGRDFTNILLGYAVTMIVGVVVAAAYYIPAGLWDAVFSGPLLIAVVSLVFSFVFLALRAKPWVIVIPALVVAFAVVLVAMAFAAPGLYQDFVWGNSIYASSIMDELASSHVSMSNVSSYYGWLTMWLPICYGLYSTYVYLRREHTATRLFVTVWMFVLFFAVWTTSANAAVVGCVFGVGSGAVIVRVLEAVDIREWASSVRHAGFPGAFRKLIKPVPLGTVLIAAILIVIPNVSYAVDAGISNNSDADYYFSGNTQYTIKTGDSYPIGEVWDQFSDEEKSGALATWMDYSYDAVSLGGFDSVTDTIGGGSSAVAQMLLAKGSAGTTAAMMLRIMMSDDRDYSSAFQNNADLYSKVAGYIDDPASAKAAILADPETYGYLKSEITDENAVYIASIEAITSEMNGKEVMDAYDAVCGLSGDKVSYILMDGSMLPLQYGDGDYFSTIAYFADYSVDNYGAATQFYSYNTYYGYTNYTSQIYDTFLWRSMIGPSASEAGYSSSYSYLVALSLSDGSEGSAKAVPGYGLTGYQVVFWQVMYNPDSEATLSSDGWEYMDGTDAIQAQRENGGVINYLSSIVMLEYVGASDAATVSGSVTCDGTAVDAATVSVYQYSDLYGRYVLFSETRTFGGAYTAFVPSEGEYMLTVSNGDVEIRSISSTENIVPDIDISTTSVEGSIVIGEDVYDQEEMKLVLTGEAGLVLTDDDGNEYVKNTYELNTADGTFAFDNILPGTYSYTLYGATGTSLGTGTVTIASGANVGLEIAPTTRTITVTVNQANGTPYEGEAIVVATNRSTGIQFQAPVEDGKAVITALSGTYTLSMGEGAVTIYTSTVSISSSNRTATVTAYPATTVTVTGAPEGTVLIGTAGSFSTLSYPSDGEVKIDFPRSMATDTMQYTIVGYSGGKVYHALYAASDAEPVDTIALAEDDAVTVSGTLKSGEDAAEGTVRFISASNEVYSAATNEDGEYIVMIPAGAYTVQADNASNRAYIGTATINGDTEGHDITMVDGRMVGYTLRYDRSTSSSNAYLPYVTGAVTFTHQEQTYTLYGMTNTSGQARFYIPDDTSDITMWLNNPEGTLDNDYFYCVHMYRTVTTGTSNNTNTLVIDPWDTDISEEEVSEEENVQFVKRQPVSIPCDMTVHFYDDASGVEEDLEKSAEGETTMMRPGQYTVTIDGRTGYYFNGTAYIYPGQAYFTGLDVIEVAAVNIDRDENQSVSIQTDGGSYRAFTGETSGYYLQVGYVYYLTFSTSETVRYAYLDLTGASAGDQYSLDVGVSGATGFDRMEVTGVIGVDADGTVTVSYQEGDAAVQHQFDVTDGAYTIVLPSGVTAVEATVEATATISSEDYYYGATATLEGLVDGAVRNIPVVSTDAPEEDTSEEDEEQPDFAVEVSDESFANGSGSLVISVTNNTSKTTTYVITGGSALTLSEDYSVTVAGGATESVTVSVLYDATRVAPGSDGFSVTVADISGGHSETVDITGGEDRSAAADINAYKMGDAQAEFNDSIGAYQYMYAVTVVNNNVYAHEVTVTASDVPAGWVATVMNEDGTVIAANGGSITVTGLQTTVVYVKLMPVSPEADESITAPDITVAVSYDSGDSKSLTMEAQEVDISAGSMSVSGGSAINERSGVPAGIWFLVVVVILLLVIVFWLASKRGVFSRRN